MGSKKANRKLMKEAVLTVADNREEMLSSEEIMKEVCDKYEALYTIQCGNAGSAKLHTAKYRTNRLIFGQYLRMYLTGWVSKTDRESRLLIWRRKE